ncbi:hypothetical protein GDI3609 [Gluconacetobacter diazotrophicus PA1 5]|uniref:Uncharacterized protein n=1 Tax=Gluconacetobacter diazotrophicus (strain ATCC 49037 / DSM 5601 / CCUG 37298 / CIP 103539 / LMG 7603 / PAl5) TaxID=272568 RepID=A9H6U7_GLUDA|nr:hypothetical protein GDI3609 [Gluconacetobacter diazotrophicus PA1 5]
MFGTPLVRPPVLRPSAMLYFRLLSSKIRHFRSTFGLFRPSQPPQHFRPISFRAFNFPRPRAPRIAASRPRSRRGLPLLLNLEAQELAGPAIPNPCGNFQRLPIHHQRARIVRRLVGLAPAVEEQGPAVVPLLLCHRLSWS